MDKIFNYNGSQITFQGQDGSLMVNATEMAKPFGKKVAHWMENATTKEFLSTLSTYRNSDSMINVVNGVGTWMHEDVALEFARWLSPSFAIWCNDRIKELVKHGMTATPEKLEDMLMNPDLLIGLARELKKEREEITRLQCVTELQENELKQSAPKVEYYDQVLQSESTFITNVIAKELGMSAVTLNRMLNQRGILYKQGGTWMLYQKYQNKGYTKTKTYSYTDKEGDTKTNIQTVWTERGRQFIHNVMKDRPVNAPVNA